MAAAARRRHGALLCALVAMSLQAVPILWAVGAVEALQTPWAVAGVGAAALAGVFANAAWLFQKLEYAPSWMGCFFVVVLWSALVDLVLAGAVVGYTDVGRFYYEAGEEYFKSAWGFWALFWDGTFHYALQLYLAYACFAGRPRAAPGLLWAGSVVNSMPVLLLGAATGVFSPDIKPATALNAPYIIAPIAIAVALSREALRAEPEKEKKKTAAAHLWFVDAVWGGVHASAAALHVWRAVVALGCAAPAAAQWRAAVEPRVPADAPSAGFLHVQLLVYAFYYAPYHAWAAWQALGGAAGSRTARALAATFVAGGYLQAATSYAVGAGWEWRGYAPLVPREDPAAQPAFWALSAGMVALAAAHAAWSWTTA